MPPKRHRRKKSNSKSNKPSLTTFPFSTDQHRAPPSSFRQNHSSTAANKASSPQNQSQPNMSAWSQSHLAAAPTQHDDSHKQFDFFQTSSSFSDCLIVGSGSTDPCDQFQWPTLANQLDSILYKHHKGNQPNQQNTPPLKQVGFIQSMDVHYNNAPPTRFYNQRRPRILNEQQRSIRQIDFHVASTTHEQAQNYPHSHSSQLDQTITLNMDDPHHHIMTVTGRHYDWETLARMIRLAEASGYCSVNVSCLKVSKAQHAVSSNDLPSYIQSLLTRTTEYPPIKPALLLYAIARADNLLAYSRDEHQRPQHHDQALTILASQYYTKQLSETGLTAHDYVKQHLLPWAQQLTQAIQQACRQQPQPVNSPQLKSNNTSTYGDSN